MPMVAALAPPETDVETLTITTPTPLPSGTEDVAYTTLTFTSTGGTMPLAWTVTAGELPNEMTLTTAGVLGGTPTDPGAFTFTVQVSDNASQSATKVFTLVIAPATTVLTIIDTVLPDARVGDTYSQSLSCVNGTAPFTWTVQSGALPTGVNLDGSTTSTVGIMGTPSATGTFQFTIRVTDSLNAHDDSGSYTVRITQLSLTINSSVLTQGEVGTAYSYTLSASNGNTPYTWAINSGKPSWMTLTSSTGALTGTPDATGDHSMVVQVTDEDATVVTKTVTLRVVAAGQAETAHDFFDQYKVHSACIQSYSLRSQTQLNGLVKQPPSPFWRYLYDGTHPDGVDDHPLKQDGAKLFKPPRHTYLQYPHIVNHPKATSLGLDKDPPTGDEGVRIPLRLTYPPKDAGTLLLVFDLWWGQEYITNNGSVNALKVVMHAAGNASGGGEQLLSCIHKNMGAGILDKSIGEFGVYQDQWGQTASNTPPGATDNDPYFPTGEDAEPLRTYPIYTNRWTRYFYEIRINVDQDEFTSWETFRQTITREDATANPSFVMPNGNYDMVTCWLSDETRDAVKCIDRAPATIRTLTLESADPNKWKTHYFLLRFGWDCSTVNTIALGGTEGMTGPWVVYARNLLAFHNLSDVDRDAILARKPVG